jgi:uncharacterized protein YecA (UPF0149 family)
MQAINTQAIIYTTSNNVTVVDFKNTIDKKNLCHDVVINIDSINGVLTVKATHSGWVEVHEWMPEIYYEKFKKKVKEEDFETVRIPWYKRSIGELLKGTGKFVIRPKEGWIQLKEHHQNTINIQTTMYLIKYK